MFVSIILVVAGLLILVGFFFYDQKCSKHKIFKPQMYNHTIIMVEIMLILTTMTDQSERLQISYNLLQKHKMTSV